jgi:hypothetical protein
MTIPISALIVLGALLAIGSIIFGFELGASWQRSQFTAKVKEDFIKKFYNRFVEEYDKAVEAEARQIVDENYERWQEIIREELKKEMENENEGTGSN